MLDTNSAVLQELPNLGGLVLVGGNTIGYEDMELLGYQARLWQSFKRRLDTRPVAWRHNNHMRCVAVNGILGSLDQLWDVLCAGQLQHATARQKHHVAVRLQETDSACEPTNQLSHDTSTYREVERV